MGGGIIDGTAATLQPPVDDTDQLCQFLLPSLSVFLFRVCVSTFEDRQFKTLFKFLGCACNQTRRDQNNLGRIYHCSCVLCVSGC